MTPAEGMSSVDGILFILLPMAICMVCVFLWYKRGMKKIDERSAERKARWQEKSTQLKQNLSQAWNEDKKNFTPENLKTVAEALTPLVEAFTFHKDPKAATEKAKIKNEYLMTKGATSEGLTTQGYAKYQQDKAETEYLITAGVTEVTQMFKMQNTILAEIEKQELILQTKLSPQRKELVEQTIRVLRAQYERVRQQTVSEIERNTP